jgi:hypothetical protein
LVGDIAAAGSRSSPSITTGSAPAFSGTSSLEAVRIRPAGNSQVVDSHADVAELPYIAATRHPIAARLVVRRVRRLHPGTGQLELDTDIWRHHAILTDRVEPLLQVEAEHRDHAIVEQVIADLKHSGMANLPGHFHANAAWRDRGVGSGGDQAIGRGFLKNPMLATSIQISAGNQLRNGKKASPTKTMVKVALT